MNGEQIRNQLELLESQTMELAAGLVGTIAEIRARLVLLETAAEMAALIGDEKAATAWPTIATGDLRRLFGNEET